MARKSKATVEQEKKALEAVLEEPVVPEPEAPAVEEPASEPEAPAVEGPASEPEAPAVEEPVLVPTETVQTGTVLSMRKVSTAICADYNVRFPQPFDEGTEPHVVVGFLTNSTAARFGACTCAVLEGSVNNEGFTIRFYNGDTSSRMPHFSYIAFGVVTK